jgi:hypothetical protein
MQTAGFIPFQPSPSVLPNAIQIIHFIYLSSPRLIFNEIDFEGGGNGSSKSALAAPTPYPINCLQPKKYDLYFYLYENSLSVKTPALLFM